MRFSVAFILTAVSLASATAIGRQSVQNVHLAVQPKCGSFSGAPADVNAGIRSLSNYKTIVAFGDAWTDGGVRDGSPVKPAVITPPSPNAGGRMCDGPVWVESLAKKAGATLKDYAAAGAVVDSTQYPGKVFSGNDFFTQTNLFTGQGVRYDPDTTLYTVFFGIGDFDAGGDLDVVAQNIAFRVLALTSSPNFARNILIVDNYGRGNQTRAGEAFKKSVFSSLRYLRAGGVNVAFVDLANVWNAILGSSPGYKAFGYTNAGACTVSSQTTIGACSDPEHSLYWIPGEVFYARSK
ncbi:hypothetical protein H0H81_006863 [Sphagnurus paluster]|uniref:Uncharacterized protein n=1 Tax=Sphagnurus paluster TaxID=117069 RepID=A0A9P7GP04_9AGAR|nr:hypothetical protein H0H81_006863 [Sphagnurus paluster]